MSGQECEQLTLFREGSPASRSALPGSEEARKMTVTSGQRCLELYKKSGPLGSLARMLLGSSAWNSTRCWLTWKPADTKCRRLYFRLVPSMPRTEGTAAQSWPTPRANDAEKRGRVSSDPRNGLPGAVMIWPTPSASDCGRTAINPHLTKNGTIRHIGKSGGQSYARLDAVAAMFPTPRGNAGTGPSNAPNRQGGPDLQTHIGGQLNPTWVEWLMGFPIGWTDLDV